MNEWISVEDRLPKTPGQYLTAFQRCYGDVDIEGRGIYIDEYRPNKNLPKNKQWQMNKYRRVTHWMPLPGMPE